MQVGMILQLLAAISFIFTSTLTEPPFVMVFTSLVFVVGSIGLIFSNGTSLVINTFPQIGGAANAIVGVVRFTISSIICSLIAFFHTGDLIPVGIGIFLTVAISNILFLWSKSSEKMKKNVVTVNI